MSKDEPTPAEPDPAEVAAALLDQARAWRDDDPDPRTRDELDRLIVRGQGGDEGALADLCLLYTSRCV